MAQRCGKGTDYRGNLTKFQKFQEPRRESVATIEELQRLVWLELRVGQRKEVRLEA